MSAIKIRVGAAVDSGVASAFMPIIAAARKARAAVDAEFSASAKTTQGVYRTNARAAEQSAAQAAKAAAKQAKEEAKAAKAAQKVWESYYQGQQKLREKDAADAAKAAEKSNAVMRKAAVDGARFAYSNVARVGRFAMDIARGAGVQLDIGSAVGRSVENKQTAVDLSNAAFNTGAPGSENRTDPAEILRRAQGAGKAHAIENAEVLAGLQAFVGKTGDLKTALALLDNMAKLTKATGANFGDMASMAGEISNGLDGVEDKGKASFEVMRAFAGQGKMGAVEVKDLASQAAKLVAAASAMGGDRAKNLIEMGALAQLSKAFGGAASATQAATSVAGLANTLKTPARIKSFKDAGVDVFETGADGMKRQKDFFKIIKESLAATKGDPEAFKKLFASTIGGKPAEAMASVFRNAGGGEKGQQAIDKMLRGYMSAGISDRELDVSAARAEGTTKSAVVRFNNAMEDVGERLADRLGPALERLTPQLVSLGDTAAKVAVAFADNPVQGIGAIVGASIVASIAKAAIGQMAGKALSAAVSALPAGSFGMATAAITIGSAVLAIKAYNDKRDEAAGEVNRTFDTTNDLLRKVGEQRKRGAVDKDLIDELARRRADIEGLRGAGKGYEDQDATALGTVKHGLTKAVATVFGGGDELAKKEGEGAAAKTLDRGLAIQAQAIDSLVGALKAGQIKVNVTVNQSGNPTVDQSNRTGP